MRPVILCQKPEIRRAAPGDQLDADLAAVQQECRIGWSEDRIIEMLGAIRDAQRGEKRALQEALAAREVAEVLLAETVERLQLTKDDLKAAARTIDAMHQEAIALREANASMATQLAIKTQLLDEISAAQRSLAADIPEPVYIEETTRWG